MLGIGMEFGYDQQQQQHQQQHQQPQPQPQPQQRPLGVEVDNRLQAAENRRDQLARVQQRARQQNGRRRQRLPPAANRSQSAPAASVSQHRSPLHLGRPPSPPSPLQLPLIGAQLRA
jgi:hypothetical protein